MITAKLREGPKRKEEDQVQIDKYLQMKRPNDLDTVLRELDPSTQIDGEDLKELIAIASAIDRRQMTGTEAETVALVDLATDLRDIFAPETIKRAFGIVLERKEKQIATPLIRKVGELEGTLKEVYGQLSGMNGFRYEKILDSGAKRELLWWSGIDKGPLTETDTDYAGYCIDFSGDKLSIQLLHIYRGRSLILSILPFTGLLDYGPYITKHRKLGKVEVSDNEGEIDITLTEGTWNPKQVSFREKLINYLSNPSFKTAREQVYKSAIENLSMILKKAIGSTREKLDDLTFELNITNDSEEYSTAVEDCNSPENYSI